MRRAHESHAFLAIAIVVAAASLDAVPAAKGPPLPYLPEEIPGAPPLTGEAWDLSTKAVSARLERIDDAARLAFIVEKTGFSIDPFAAAKKPNAYVTFRLDLENRSASVIVFQPLNCRIYSPGQNGWRGPLDLPALQSTYEVFDQPMPMAYLNVGKAIFDGEVLLNPGEKRSGLLVFPAVDPKWRAFHVEIGWTTADAKRESFDVSYRRQKK